MIFVTAPRRCVGGIRLEDAVSPNKKKEPMRIKRTTFGLVAAAMLAAASLGAVSAPADAANGDQLIFGGDFSTYPSVNGLLNVPGATSDFSLANPGGYNPGNGSMYDPGRYIVTDNPNSVHEAWASFSGDPMLVVNGFTEGHQKVISVTTQGQVCTTPGSNVSFQFGANATNVLRPEWAAEHGLDAPGAVISVTVNGTSIGSADLTGVNPNNPVSFGSGVPVPASATGEYVVTIWNDGTAYTGNDFAIDDITLTQVGDCAPPCVDEVKGQWWNYTGNFAKTGKDVNHDGIPDLDDPNWHAVSGTPGGEHDVTVRGFDKPYQPGKSGGNGSWFKWTDIGHKCPR